MMYRKVKGRFSNTKILIFAMVLLGIVGLMYGVPVFAAQCGGAEVSILGCDENEGGIWHILNLVIQILSIGIGILGVVGILVVGIQILTAKDSPEVVKKAKTRLGQIIIGLALYALLFALSQWLLPGGLANSSTTLQGTGTTTQVKEMEAKQEAARQEAEAKRAEESGGSESDTESETGSVLQKTNAQRIEELAKVAKSFASKKNRAEYQAAVKSTGAGGDSDTCKKLGKACGVFVSTVVRSVLGIKNFPNTSDKIFKYVKKHPKQWKIIKASDGKPQPGDIVFETGGGVWTSHSGIFVSKNGKTVIAEASYPKGGASNSECSNGSSPRVTSYTTGGNRYGRPDGYYIRYIGGK